MNRWFLPLNTALLVSIIALSALITADLLSFRISRLFPAKVAAPGRSVPSAHGTGALSTYAPILAQGLFGKATQGTLTPILAKRDEKAPPAAINQADYLLLGTVQGSARESFALIEKISTKEERVFRVGERVFDSGTLVTVHKESIEILSGTARSKLFTPNLAAPSGGKPAASEREAPTASSLATETSSGNFVIDQRSLNASLDNIGQAMTDARLLPSTRNGTVEGFRISEVKPQGIFGKIGIKNGDILLRMNDFPIDSPEKAMQSLVSLKGQSRISLDLIREGQPRTFNYEIR